MHSLKDLLADKPQVSRSTSHKTNKFFLLAEEIAKATNTTPNRWLREVKNHENVCSRALALIKELSPRNPAAYFTFLLKKFKLPIDKTLEKP